MNAANYKGKHAIVIGGSMAGLLAARVLSDHFERVTVIERDLLPTAAEFRPGVPQAHHLHILLAQGRKILIELFPEFETDLAELGSPNVDLSADFAGLTAGGWTKRFKSGFVTNTCSRVGLEWLVRRRVAALMGVEFLAESEVDALLMSEDGARVIGVHVESRRDRSAQTLLADLIVDASGRTSRMPDWLQSLGYEKPQETTVNAYLGYATRWYEPPPHFHYDWKILLLSARPKAGILRGGGILVVEDQRWSVTLAGTNKDYPPTDEAAFLEFARSLAHPALFEAIEHARPLSPIHGYRRTENRWRHYERLTRFPDRLLVIGDSFCAFNPIYGQGMTVAALEACELCATLTELPLEGIGAAYHRRQAGVVKNVWLLATGEDLRYPLTEGARPGRLERFVQVYVERLIETLPYNDQAQLAFIQATNLLRPPAKLLEPALALSVLRHHLGGLQPNTQINAPVQYFRESSIQP